MFVFQHIAFDNVWSNYQEALDAGSLSIPLTLTTKAPTTHEEHLEEAGLSQDKLCTVNVAQHYEYAIDLVATLPSATTKDGQESHQIVKEVRGSKVNRIALLEHCKS